MNTTMPIPSTMAPIESATVIILPAKDRKIAPMARYRIQSAVVLITG